MKYLLILLILTNYLFSQIIVEKSELELTNLQVNDMVGVSNYLYVLTQLDNKVALDKLDLNSNQMYNDFLKEKGISLSAQATLFKSKNDDLWVGDFGKLLKIDPKTNSVESYVNFFKIEDSTTYRITSITEDEFGNIYCLVNSVKLIKTEKLENGTTIRVEVSRYELIKLENNSFTKLYQFEKEVPLFFKMKYHLGKIIVPSFGGSGSSLFVVDLSSKTAEEIVLKTPYIKELEDWEKVEEIRVLEFLTLKNQLYFISEIRAGLGHFKAISKLNLESKEIKYMTLERDTIEDIMPNMTSYFQLNDKMIVSTNYYDDKNKKFYIFENDKFIPYDISHINTVKLITRKNHFQSLSDLNRLDFLSLYLRIDRGMYLDKNGTLYGGNGNGLLKVENFLQPTSVQAEELNISTFPDLASVKNELIINSEFIISSYRMYDVNSKTLQTKSNLNSNDIYLNLEDLTVGIYFIELETQKGNKLLKFIKN